MAASAAPRGVPWLTGNRRRPPHALRDPTTHHGYGHGISVLVPGRKLPPGVRALSLPGFPEVSLAALWRGTLPTVMQALLEEMRQAAQALKAHEA